MLFNSLEFLLFLPIVFALYWATNAWRRDAKGLKLQNALLLLSSYVFYGWWDWRFLSLIGFSTLVDWAGGWIAYKESMQKLSLNPQVQYISLEEADLPDEFYKDCDHLNENGHHWLADTLNSLITEADIQATEAIAPLTSPK